MDEITKNDSTEEDTPTEKRTEEKEVDESSEKFIIYKLETHRGQRCLLNGVDVERQLEFNLMNEITVSQQELEVIGNYRWLGVKK